jgi:hypothetical protein
VLVRCLMAYCGAYTWQRSVKAPWRLQCAFVQHKCAVQSRTVTLTRLAALGASLAIGQMCRQAFNAKCRQVGAAYMPIHSVDCMADIVVVTRDHPIDGEPKHTSIRHSQVAGSCHRSNCGGMTAQATRLPIAICTCMSTKPNMNGFTCATVASVSTTVSCLHMQRTYTV